MKGKEMGRMIDGHPVDGSLTSKLSTKKPATKKLVVVAVVLLVVLLLAAAVQPASAVWDYYRCITIQHEKVSGDQNLQSFPVLINHTADWLKFEDKPEHVRESHGYDIVFTNADNTTLLDYEIEEYNGTYNGTHGRLVAWVRIPTLDYNDNTTIRLWYGNSGASDWSNPEGVWDTNYTMVQHLNETSGTQYDSTVNDNDGTPHFDSTDQNATGKIDGADYFNGVDDYVDCGNNDSLNITNALTLEAWVFETADARETIIDKTNSSNDGYRFGVDIPPGCKELCAYIEKGGKETECCSDVTMELNKWHYVVFTYDKDLGSENMKLYLNGTKINATAAPNGLGVSSKNLVIGKWGWANWVGKLDEIRISDTARSWDGINTTYNNTNSPSSFYEVGGPEDPHGADPVPDVSALVLFAAGLVVLVVFFGWRKRRRGVDG